MKKEVEIVEQIVKEPCKHSAKQKIFVTFQTR